MTGSQAIMKTVMLERTRSFNTDKISLFSLYIFNTQKIFGRKERKCTVDKNRTRESNKYSLVL
jgi:hypothetical protein